MFFRKEFKLHTIAGKNFIFLLKEDDVDMTRILSFNKSSVWLWKQLEGKEFTEEEAFDLLNDHFEGDSIQMRQNLKWWIKSLSDEGVIEI